MLLLDDARMMFLANPKTATQSTRAMLEPFTRDKDRFRKAGTRHMGVKPFRRQHQPALEAELGGPLICFAVMREPLDHLFSWYRYRQRPDVSAEASTKDISFEDFLQATLQETPPVFANVGRQSVFLAAKAGTSDVDHLFDHGQIDVMLGFLQLKLGERLYMPKRNISPVVGSPPKISITTFERIETALAADFALYKRLEAKGHLTRRN